jgi:tRNA 5-methylaminomethyl-2-thiouridine biosynthesis bifunctional protein
LDLDFGDGSRLLAAGAALLRDSDSPEHLHYVAVIDQWSAVAAIGTAASAFASVPDIDRAHAAAFAAQLRSAWLPAVPGFQRLLLGDGRMTLTLVAGTLASSLPQLALAFDAAYCRLADAAPDLIRWLGRLAAPKALLTVDVQDADVSIRKEFAQAGFAEGDMADGYWSFRFAPRHMPPQLVNEKSANEKHAIVIGAGLAGAAACHRLVARGWRCTLIEQYALPATQASGNAAGIFMPVLSRDDNPLSRLTRSAYLFALHLWECLGGVGRELPGQACGVLQLARSDAAPDSAANVRTPWDYPPDFARRMSAAKAEAALQQRVAGGWWFPAAGWLQPAAVCEAMLKACGEGVRMMVGRQAVRLMRDAGNWHAVDAEGTTIAHAPVAILANGAQAMQFAQTAHLPLTSIRGQVTHLPVQSADVPFVVCGDAYLTPAAQGMASLGATYDQAADTALRPADHLENIRHLQQMLPDWHTPSDVAALDGRVGFRCVAADRLPLVGALPDPDRLAGSGDVRLQDMPRLPGLHGLLAYGSRGLIWSPLMAELLAAQLNGEPLPLPRDLAALLDPARFALKERRRPPDGPNFATAAKVE